MRPQYTPNQHGTYNNQDAMEVIDSLEPGEDSAVYMALLIGQVERLLKEKNTASMDKKNIGPVQVKEVIAAMIAGGYWEPNEHKTRLINNESNMPNLPTVIHAKL